MAPSTITYEQMRGAILEVLAGTVVKPVGTEFCGLEFDTIDGLRAGARLRLEQLSLIPVLVPKMPYWPSSAFEPDDEAIFRKVCDDLFKAGVIRSDEPIGRSGTGFTVALLPGPFAQRWQFIEELRGGGQSATFRVREKETGTIGVLKLPKGLEDAAAKRFRREVEILKTTSHPTVVRLLDVNLEGPDIGYVTPFGTPLDDYWASEAPKLSPGTLYDRAYALVRRLADGIAAIHAKGLSHRDLKPANVIMFGDEPVIIDFGVANTPEYAREDLTAHDGRHVENGPVPYYWKDEERDLVGLAWIYGLLLETPGVPKHRHCNWQFHELVEEPRAERLRAILAACSVKELLPINVNTLMELIDRYGLGVAAPGAASITASNGLSAAELAHAERSAHEALRKTVEIEGVAGAVQLLSFLFTRLRQKLIDVCVGSERAPVTQYGSDRYPFLPLPGTEEIPMAKLLQQAYERRDDADGGQVVGFFSCTCQSVKPFHIVASVAYSRHYVQDALRFRLLLECRDDGGPTPNLSHLYATLASGIFRNDDVGGEESVDKIADRTVSWIRNEYFWGMGLPPPPERRQPDRYEKDLLLAMATRPPVGY